MDESHPNMQLLGQKIATTKGNVTASWRQRNLRSGWRVRQYRLTTWLRQRAPSVNELPWFYRVSDIGHQEAFPKHESSRSVELPMIENTRGQECAVPSELETTHSHNDRKWSESVRTPTRTETQDMSAGIQTPRSTQNNVRRRETTWLEHTRSSHENPDMTGVSGLCHKTMNDTRPKWQNPDTCSTLEPI